MKFIAFTISGVKTILNVDNVHFFRYNKTITNKHQVVFMRQGAWASEVCFSGNTKGEADAVLTLIENFSAKFKHLLVLPDSL